MCTKDLFNASSIKKKILFKPIKTSTHLSEQCEQRKSQSSKYRTAPNTIGRHALSRAALNHVKPVIKRKYTLIFQQVKVISEIALHNSHYVATGYG